MNRFPHIILLLSIPAIMLGQGLIPNLGGQRAGTAIFTFLKIDPGAAGAAMAGAGVAMPTDASSMYYNPANLARLNRRDFVVSRSEWPADTQYDYFAASVPFRQYHYIGLSYGVLHSDPMLETTVYQPFGTGRTFNYRDEFFALTYSIQLADRFSFGTTVKYVVETLSDLLFETADGSWPSYNPFTLASEPGQMQALLFDFGTYYITGYRSLRITSSFTNFGRQTRPGGSFIKTVVDNESGEEVEAEFEFQNFSPPTTFRLGAAYEIIENSNSKLSLAFQLTHPADNVESYALGADYQLQDVLHLRAGIASRASDRVDAVSDESKISFGLSFGAGIQLKAPGGRAIRIDYAYTQFGYLTSPQRFTIGFAL